jgi:antitoxin (DNA-binding transcriptional repressor) of toxin-antitoxin stability system
MTATTAGETTSAYSLFQQPWWLDAVAPGAWSEVSVTEDGRVVARLPYVRKTRYGLTMLGQPPLTHTLGPWIEPYDGKPTTALAREEALLGELIERLPPADRFLQAFSPELLDALPFHWAGSEIAVRYTYRLDDLTSEERLWEGLDSATRGTIRKARRTVEIRTDLGLDVAYELAVKTYARQGLGVPFSKSLLERIDAACAPRGARQLLFAVDAKGVVHAGTYAVFDRDAAYGIVSGGDPAVRSSGAGLLLIWEAVTRAASSTSVFDFGGSMLRPVERIFRGFGARQTPYLLVSRHSRRLRALLALKQLGEAAAPRRFQRSAGGEPRA